MLIIEKRKLIIVLILSFVLISASSVWAYNVGINHGLKSGSELVLFFGFIGAGLQLILSISIILYAEKKRGDFYMLLEKKQKNWAPRDSICKRRWTRHIT